MGPQVHHVAALPAQQVEEEKHLLSGRAETARLNPAVVAPAPVGALVLPLRLGRADGNPELVSQRRLHRPTFRGFREPGLRHLVLPEPPLDISGTNALRRLSCRAWTPAGLLTRGSVLRLFCLLTRSPPRAP